MTTQTTNTTVDDKDEDDLTLEMDGKDLAVTMEDETTDEIPWDTGWAWMVVLGSFMSHLILVGFVRCLGILYIDITDVYKTSTMDTAWIAAVMMIVANFLSPFIATLVDRVGVRILIIIGGVLQGVGIGLSAFAPDVTYLYITVGALFGVGAACVFGPTKVAVGHYFKRYLALANGLSMIGSSIGQFAIPPLVTYLLSIYSLRGTWIILAGVVFNVCVSGALQRPVSFYRNKRRPVDGALQRPASGVLQRPASGALKTRDEKKHRQISRKPLFLDDDTTDKIIRKPWQPPLSKSTDRIHCYEASPRLRADANLLRGVKSEETLAVPGAVARSRSHETFLYASYSNLHAAPSICFAETPLAVTPRRPGTTSKWRSFVEMILAFYDLRLFKNSVFVLFAVATSLAHVASMGEFRFLPLLATEIGVDAMRAAFVLSAIGVSDLFGRLLAGVFSDLEFVKSRLLRYRLVSLSLLLSGITTVCLTFISDYVTFLAVCVILGLLTGMYMILMSVTIVDLLGRENLAKSWGCMLLLWGITSIAEPLLLAKMRDYTGDLKVSFYICGVLYLISSVCMICIHFPLKSQRQQET